MSLNCRKRPPVKRKSEVALREIKPARSGKTADDATSKPHMAQQSARSVAAGVGNVEYPLKTQVCVN